MLTLVPPGRERLADARELLFVADDLRPLSWWVLGLLVVVIGVALILAGQAWGGLPVGAVIAHALSRYGPQWWPGRR